MKWEEIYVSRAEVRKIIGDLARRGVSYVTYPVNRETTLIRVKGEK